MIYITQLIYLKDGQEKIFQEFENIALPIIPAYKGKLLLRLRPKDDSFVEFAMEKPYEIHLVEFDNHQDFDNFMKDEGRKKFLHLKEQAIRESIMIIGSRL